MDAQKNNELDQIPLDNQGIYKRVFQVILGVVLILFVKGIWKEIYPFDLLSIIVFALIVSGQFKICSISVSDRIDS